MKSEYLNRSVTINHKSLETLVEEVGKDLVEEGDVGIKETMILAVASGSITCFLREDLFGESDEAITVRGEDFAAKELAALRKLSDCADEADALTPGKDVTKYVLAGLALYVVARLEDKLFGSDHVEEHEAVKNKKEEPHD